MCYSEEKKYLDYLDLEEMHFTYSHFSPSTLLNSSIQHMTRSKRMFYCYQNNYSRGLYLVEIMDLEVEKMVPIR